MLINYIYMPSSCDICWHQKCFSRSAEAMVLIIQLRSEHRWVVNEKYTDSDLCKVSLQMTELTNSSQGAAKTGSRRRGPRCLRIRWKNSTFNLSESSGYRVGWTLTRSERSRWLLTRESAPEITAAEEKKQNLRPEFCPGTGGIGTSRKTTVWFHNECAGISIMANVLISP